MFNFFLARLLNDILQRKSCILKDSTIILYKWLKGQVEFYLLLQQTTVCEVDVKMLLGFISLHSYCSMSSCWESYVPCEGTAAV